MKLRTYYLIRIAFLFAIAVAAPIWALGSPYGLRGWSLVIAEAVILALAGFFIWRYRKASEDATYGPPPEVFQRMAARRSRKYAWIAIVGCAVAIAAEYWRLRSTGKLDVVAVLILPAILLLGLAGLVNPDYLWGARNDVPDLPQEARTVSRAVMIGGLAIGAYLCYLWFIPH